jgi:galactokinase
MNELDRLVVALRQGDLLVPSALLPRIARLETLFRSRFAGQGDSRVFLGFVPGRIEILGKHTDYAGGHSIVCAIDRGFLFLAGPNGIGRIRMAEDSAEFAALDFPLEPSLQPPAGSWANYPMTMARRLAANFSGDRGMAGVDIAFSSDMPVGSGMSGSSALMMMTFCAISWTNRLHERETFTRTIRDGIDLAMYMASCENGQTFRELAGDRGVGTFGGSEDHTAILNCRAGRLSLFSYAPTVFKAEMQWPAEWALVVAFSGIRAEKTAQALEKYNLAARRAALAVEAYNRRFGTALQNLGEIAAHNRDRPGARLLQDIAGSAPEHAQLDLAGRLRHFLLEEERYIPAAVRGLLWRNAEAFGAALTSSHRASKKYLRNIAPEIDHLQRSAVSLGASGASGFGAGFGGSIVAVLPAARAEPFARDWQEAYARRYPAAATEACFFRTAPGPGIRLWDMEGEKSFVDEIFDR